MSNILIIKHGSLGDIAQACGAIQDISENHNNDQIYLLTTKPYFDLFKKNPYLTDVILDKRLSRFNLIYLYFLMRKIKKLKIFKVYDLQNSSRTSFYKKILFPSSNYNTWSSSETTIPKDKTKEEFDKKSVLERFNHQLQTSGINTKHTMFPNFSWSCTDVSKIKSEHVLVPIPIPAKSSLAWRGDIEIIITVRIIMKKELRPNAMVNLYAWNLAGSWLNYGNFKNDFLSKKYTGKLVLIPPNVIQ